MRGLKTGGKDFGPEHQAWGRPRIPEDIKRAREATRFQFERIAHNFLTYTPAELANAANNPQTPALEATVASIVLKALAGEAFALALLLERSIGIGKRGTRTPVSAHSFEMGK